MKNNYLESFQISLPRASKPIKATYTTDELKKLLKKPNVKECSFGEYKIWALYSYLLGTGNRISTALNIKVRDVNLGDWSISLNVTKGRRGYIIPISASLSEILAEYIFYRDGNDDDFLFCNKFGLQGSLSSYEKAAQAYNEDREIYIHGFHRFRHTFAKMWILNGGDMFRLQKILGHKDLTMVREYVEMFSGDIAKSFSSFNPLDTISPKVVGFGGKKQKNRRYS